MKVLVLGSDTPLGHALGAMLERLGRHEVTALTRAACRWKSERQAKKAVVRTRSDIVVDLRISAASDGGDPLQDIDVKRCHWVAKASQRSAMTYLYVSTSRVFSGQLDRPYKEEDTPDNATAAGDLLARAEQVVQDSCEQHLILRLGPVFSFEGTNLITQMLGELGHEGGSLVMDNNLRGCPVAAGDGARVISALLDQLGTGMRASGIYHYCSSDSATYYEFAEALLASASQFSQFSPDAVQLERQPEGLAPLNRALECARIRNTFAIKQAPWRSAIPGIVKQYYLEQKQQQKPALKQQQS
ncbi:MAG: sugar nucleotide-binding protein [Halieaceae bacterium]|nr:sugar nucleotide-binding protein [Halieaceae bacterium]MCP5204060.1 sugar nucleotide-binding protein [Pseudomonadales bacterium]